MKISNYNPTSSELVKCEFQKEVKLTVFAPTTIPSYGDDAVIEKSSTIIDDSEQTPVKNKAQFKQLNENSFNNFTTKVSGSNNYVNRTSKDVEILGDNNRVSSNSKNIRLVNSDNNFIGAGVENVTLINSNNLEVLESDVTYINGLITEGTDHHSGFKTINTGQTVEIKTNKQMTNFNKLTNNGTLDINGDLILR
tara:strand:- start:151 stop:735 length:585 start_codon:yes stop_codon:yes gene_type:complete